MVYFKSIKKDKHYVEEHEKDVPWSEVITVILRSSKNMRKKGNKIEIENAGYYLLCEVRGQELYVINAKRKR